MTMLKFVREHELPNQIVKPRQSGDKIQIAVPFWGVGGAKSLGLEKWKNVEVICNLESGACNPYAVEELLKAGIEVRSHRRLHAKIYIFNGHVIIGSSNVSSNGLAKERSETKAWVEANVMSDEQILVGKARALFQHLWKNKTTRVVQLDSQFLNDAKRDWDTKPWPPTKSMSLLAACKERPELFESLFLAIYTEDLSPKADQKMQALRTAKRAERGLNLASLQNAWGYQFWIGRPGDWIIDFDCQKEGKEKICGCAQVQNLVLNVPEEGKLYVAIKANVRLAGSDREFKLSAKEKALLQANAEALKEMAGDDGLVQLKQALDRLGF
ncbi:MAG: phospholipase D-like domain-containing protein [Bradyrhizobium sp.]